MPCIAFDGPCLGGKSTMIAKLNDRLRNRGFSISLVREYTDVAGGHRALPHILSSSPAESAHFFVQLETIRMEQVHLARYSSFILLDRTLISCLLLRRHIGDTIGLDILVNSINAGTFVMPDLIIFLTIDDTLEYRQRLAQRTLFSGWEEVYRLYDFDEFFSVAKCYCSVPVVPLEGSDLDAAELLILNTIGEGR